MILREGKMKKKRLRDMNWNDYGISKNRYKELKAFCLQYEEKKNKIGYKLNAVNCDGMPKGSKIGNPTENAALRNEQYKRDCFLIETSAKEANSEIWEYILKSVTQGLPYEMIEFDEKHGRIPMGKTEFNATRRLFYYYLNELKSGFKLSKIV